MRLKVLVKLREKYSLTQVEMAKRIKVSISDYTKTEGGFKTPSFNFIQKVKNTFPEVDANDFFK
nr:helix-turn-helix transcriptional regulator [uncultured Trichococcus sp.]